MSKIYTVKLEYYDDVASIRDKLQFAKTQRVLLIFPNEGQRKILKSKVDLLLIQREATRRNLQLAILTDDPDLAEHAKSLNLSAFYSLRQARSRQWKHAQNQVFAERPRTPNAPHPYELMSVASRIRPRLSSRQARGRVMGQAIIGLILLVVLGGGMLMVVPGATVTISPAKDSINEAIVITADPNIQEIDVLNGLVPAQLVEAVFPGSPVTVETTGRRDAEDSLAEGVVTFTNETEAAVFVPINTVVRTVGANRASFRTTADVALPARRGSTGEVRVVALPESSGLDGNVQPEAINVVEGALDTLVSVRNVQATFGGGLVQEGVVTDVDHERLINLARDGVVQAARNELLLQLPSDDQFLVPGSVQLIEERPEWTVFSAQVGDASESVTLNMRGLVQAVVVDELQARQLAFILLSRRLPDQREIDQSSLRYRRENQGTDEQGRTQFLMIIEGDSYYEIDGDEVATRIRGKSIDDALFLLDNEYLLDPRYPPSVSMFPIDIGRVPLLTVRIHVEINRR